MNTDLTPPCEGREAFPVDLTQVKHFKAGKKRGYSSEEIMVNIMEKELAKRNSSNLLLSLVRCINNLGSYVVKKCQICGSTCPQNA